MGTLVVGILIGLALGYVVREGIEDRSETSIREGLKRELEDKAAMQQDRALAEHLRQAATLVAAPRTVKQSPAAQQNTTQALAAQPGSLVPRTSAGSPWTAGIRHMDSITALLYFGAFLLIAGVGVFVGLSPYSGGVKVVTVLTTALAFYAAGLYTYRSAAKLRPAGVTLTAIGLTCLPLTGVATYTYFGHRISGASIWLDTSIISLGLYLLALKHIRQSLIGFASVFMGVSLWLSIVAVISAPVYYFAWAMIVLGMGYLVAARFLKRWHVEMPLTTSASIMVPTALVMMLLFGTGYAALTREGASAVLAAVFYAEAAWLEGNSGVRRLHAVLSYGLVPLGTVLLTYGLVHSAALCSFALTAVTFCQLFTVTSAPSLQRYERSFLRISAGSLAAGAIAAWTSGNWQLLAIILIADLLVTASIGILRADKLYTSLALIAFLILPAEVGRMASDPPLAGGILVSLYVAAAILLITAGHRLRPLGLSRLFVFGYSGALALAFAIGCSAGGGTAGLATAAVALCTIFCAYYERRPDVLLVSTVAGGVAVMQILGWHNWLTGSLISIALGGLGLAYYAANWTGQRLLNDIRYRQIWLVSGVTSLYVAALGGMGQGTIPWPSIVVLGFAGAITGYEARLRAHKGAIAVAAGVLTAAAQLALFKLGLREWQLYFYLWGMYAVYLAYYLVMPAAVYLSLIINGTGMAAGLLDHGTFSMRTMTIAVAVLAGGYYGIGKLRIVERHIERLNPLAETWLRAGIGGLFAAVLVSLLIGGYAPLDGSAYLPSALALLASGSLAAYETYLHHNREGLYVAGGIVLLGLEWLMYLSRIDHLQLYTHLWALYFALLAWFAHRDGRRDEKRTFILLALMCQTVPLALQALAGDTLLGLVLLVESIALLVYGLWIRNALIGRWGLIVGVASVLYQLRDYQFFVLVFLGAIVIGLGVYLLLRQDKGNP